MPQEILFIFPFLAFFLAQISKFFIKGNKLKFNLRTLFSYSGMPSAHSALVVGLTIVIGFLYGILSGIFVLSLVFTVIVISDALHLRSYMAKQGKTINALVKDLDEDQFLDDKYPKMIEYIGHTPAQIIAGVIIGIVFAVVGWLIVL